MERWLRLANRIYQLLMFAYPSEFRRKYAAEMAIVFAEECKRGHQHSGPRGVALVWCATMHDLVVSICAEHVSQFLAYLKRDSRALLETPAFAALFAAIVSILFFICRLILVGASEEPLREQFLPYAIASFNLVILWLTSILVLQAVKYHCRADGLGSPIFPERIRAFRHLAAVALLFSICPIIRLLIFTHSSSALNSVMIPLPAPLQWLIGPIVLLSIIFGIFALEPLLTVRTHLPSR
jgi:hypothetical protein